VLGLYTAGLRFVPTPQAGADAWSQGVSAGATKWADRIASTNKDQAQLAVAAQGALVANFNDAVNSGRWAQGVTRRGTAYWKSQSALKAGNYGGAAQSGKDNYARAAAQLYPYEAQLQAQVDSMPSGTRAASLARFTTWMDGMIAVKGQFRA